MRNITDHLTSDRAAVFEYEVARSKRKTISVEITRDAKVLVRAPLRAPKYMIEDFVKRHGVWIEKHLAATESALKSKRDFSFADGQSIYFIGEELIIRTDHYITRLQIIGNSLHISDKIPQEAREQAIILFLKAQALPFFETRVAEFAPRLNVMPEAVTVTSAKTRWGSCSGKRRICFSYRLISMPAEIIDYVVVHELAHLLEHNHSHRFYAHVESILPDYRRLQNELKAFSKRLTF